MWEALALYLVYNTLLKAATNLQYTSYLSNEIYIYIRTNIVYVSRFCFIFVSIDVWLYVK